MKKSFLVLIILLFAFVAKAADQANFPDIYVDADADVGGVGSLADPYDTLDDINWTTGGDNSIYDYINGTPSQDVVIHLDNGTNGSPDIWRETLTVGASGTSSYAIKITDYDAGSEANEDKPIITGTDEITGFSQTQIYQDIWTAEEQTGDSTWSNSVNLSNRNYRVAIYGSGGHITSSATSIKITLYNINASATSTIENTAIGPKGDGSGEDVYDYEGGASPTNVQFDSSDSVEIPTSSTVQSDAITYTINSSNDYLISFHSTAFKHTCVSEGSGSNNWYKNEASDETETTDVADYVDNGGADVPVVHSIQGLINTNVYEKGSITTVPLIVIFDGTIGTEESTFADLDTNNEWYYCDGCGDGDDDTLYIYSSSDPSGRTIEAGQRSNIIVSQYEYIEFENLELYGLNSASGGIIVSNGAAGGGGYLTFDTLEIWGSMNHGIYLLNNGNHTLTDLTIYNNDDIGAYFIESSDSYDVGSITISGGSYHDNNDAGIYFWGSNDGTQKITSGGTITGVTAYNNGDGIYFTNTDDVTVSECTLYNNDDEDGIGDGYGVGISNADDIIIEKSKIYGNRTRGIEAADSATNDPSENPIIRYNSIYDNGSDDSSVGVGVMFGSAASSMGGEIYGNIIYDHDDTLPSNEMGIYLSQGAAAVKIYNNTLYNNIDTIVLEHSDNDNCLIKNNIVSGSTTYNIKVVAGITGSDINYNLYDDDTGTMFSWNGSDYNYADWKSNSSQDSNSPAIASPSFGTAGSDFTLDIDSPCIDAGIGVSGYGTKFQSTTALSDFGVAATIDTTIVGNRPDIGAYEYPIWGAP